MILLDTDTFSLLTSGHRKTVTRRAAVTDAVGITIITRIEALEGRFAFLMRAATGEELLRAQQWLRQTATDLSRFILVPIDRAAADQFDRLRGDRKLKKIGRADLLIAAIALANRAILVTRNRQDFRLVPGLQVENWVD